MRKLVFFLIFSLGPPIVFACGELDDVTVYIGKGDMKVETLDIRTKFRAFQMLDDDGLANLFMISTAVRNLTDAQIKTLQTTVGKSISKAIYNFKGALDRHIKKQTSARISESQRLANIKVYQQLIADLQALQPAVASGLKRKHFAFLIKNIIGPAESHIGYNYKIVVKGAFVLQPKNISFQPLFAAGYSSLFTIRDDGTFPKGPGGCAGLSSKIANMPK